VSQTEQVDILILGSGQGALPVADFFAEIPALIDELVKGTVGYGDEYLPQSPTRRFKLTDAQVREIRDRYAFEFPQPTQQQLADKYGVSPSTVSAIVTGKSWKWLA